MVSSTRRFWARPSAVSLGATGWFSPSPTTIRRALRTPRLVRYAATDWARRCDSAWLYSTLPTESVCPATSTMVWSYCTRVPLTLSSTG